MDAPGLGSSWVFARASTRGDEGTGADASSSTGPARAAGTKHFDGGGGVDGGGSEAPRAPAAGVGEAETRTMFPVDAGGLGIGNPADVFYFISADHRNHKVGGIRARPCAEEVNRGVLAGSIQVASSKGRGNGLSTWSAVALRSGQAGEVMDRIDIAQVTAASPISRDRCPVAADPRMTRMRKAPDRRL